MLPEPSAPPVARPALPPELPPAALPPELPPAALEELAPAVKTASPPGGSFPPQPTTAADTANAIIPSRCVFRERTMVIMVT